MKIYNLKYQLGGNTKNGHLKWNEKGLVVDKIDCIGKKNLSRSYKYYKCEYSLNPFKCNEIAVPDSRSRNIKYCNKSEEIDYSWVKYGNIGINNLGTTCYANSYLQAILHSYSFIYHVKLLDIKDDFNTLIDQKFKFNKKEALDLPKSNNFIECSDQQDAQEYLNKFLDKIYENDDYMLKNVDISSQFINLKIKPPKIDENISFYDNTMMYKYGKIVDTSEILTKTQSKHKYLNQNYTYNLSISKYFFDFILCSSNTVKNKTGYDEVSFKKHRLEFQQQLQISITSNNLISCLRENFKIEDLKEQNRIYTEQEGLEWDQKELKLLSTPIYFIISLKRFNNYGSKISDKVEIPLELDETDLREFMYKNSQGDCNDPGTYDLYAVTMQLGSLTSGHYYSYIRKPNFNNEKLNSDTFTPGWYEANDNSFKKFDLREDIKEKIKDGYIFYYKKRDLDDVYPHMLGNEDVRYQYV